MRTYIFLHFTQEKIIIYYYIFPPPSHFPKCNANLSSVTTKRTIYNTIQYNAKYTKKRKDTIFFLNIGNVPIQGKDRTESQNYQQTIDPETESVVNPSRSMSEPKCEEWANRIGEMGEEWGRAGTGGWTDRRRNEAINSTAREIYSLQKKAN